MAELMLPMLPLKTAAPDALRTMHAQKRSGVICDLGSNHAVVFTFDEVIKSGEKQLDSTSGEVS